MDWLLPEPKAMRVVWEAGWGAQERRSRVRNADSLARAAQAVTG